MGESDQATTILTPGELVGIEGKLIVTDVVPLDTSRLVTPGDISSLAYTVIPWLVGQALVQTPMQAARPIKLYQAADSSLLAWDDPIVSENDVRYASALHAIEPSLVLLRGRLQPYIQLHVKLTQVMPNLVGKKKHAWVKTGDLIVKAKLKTKKTDEGWETTYEHPVEKLLTFMGVQSFPPMVDGDIPVDSDVRPIYAIPPSNPMIASGPGPLFLDQAGFHLLTSLPGTAPLLVKKAVASLREEKVVTTGEVANLNVMVLAAHADVMLRLQPHAQASLHRRYALRNNRRMTLQAASGSHERAFVGDCEQCGYFIAVSIVEQLGVHDVKALG